ncbi:MAG: hypothetical protein KAU48_10035 [Candidatus Thorarchaeota archaeon]|nr:hypothetical protein [Candidatus Thorarchaeota archaeon]
MVRGHTKLVLALFFVSFLFLSSSLAVAQSGEMTTITWHSSVTTNAIFGWQVTHTDSENETTLFPLGDKLVGLGDVIQINFVANPPTDAEQFFGLEGPPTWVYMYVDGQQIDYNQMGDEGLAFLILILPVSFEYDNGTSFGLTELDRIGTPYEDMESYYHVNSTHINATFVDEYVRLNYITNLETGIARYLSAEVYELGFSMILEFFTEAANVNEEGETETIEPEYNTFVGVSMGNEIYLMIGGAGAAVAVVVIIIILKRR